MCWDMLGRCFFWPLMTPVDFAAPKPFFVKNNQVPKLTPILGKGCIYKYTYIQYRKKDSKTHKKRLNPENIATSAMYCHAILCRCFVLKCVTYPFSISKFW